MEKIRVGVAFGGRSAEHEVSLQSAKNVLNALDREKYEPVLIGIDREGRWHLEDETRLLFDAARPLPRLDGDHDHEVTLAVRGEGSRLISLSEPRRSDALDVIFPVLHGPYGEDGSIQGLCRLANLPCVGAGILGSAVGMDKDVMKRLLREAGIATARFRAISRGKRSLGFDEAKAELGAPLFVKPANMGSSVGVSKARTRAEYDAGRRDGPAIRRQGPRRGMRRRARAGMFGSRECRSTGLRPRRDRDRGRPRLLRLSGEIHRRERRDAAHPRAA